MSTFVLIEYTFWGVQEMKYIAMIASPEAEKRGYSSHGGRGHSLKIAASKALN
jgi:hypothetical protein